MIKIKKLYIVLGTGGSRKDFVTGWLGKLPNFIDTKWYIDLVYGASYTDFQYIKTVDVSPENTFIQMLNEKNVCVDDNSELNLAVTCHGINLSENLKGLLPHQYEVININVDSDSLSSVFWQNFVKNFLHVNTGIDQLSSGDYSNKDILKYITDSDESHLGILDTFFSKDNPSFKEKMILCQNHDYIKQFQYSELFKTGGSKILCDKLNLNTIDTVHRYWDAMLPFADVPDEIEFLGRLWKKSDYIK